MAKAAAKTGPVKNIPKRKATNYIVIHCSATRPSMNVGAAEIRKWHLDKGWSDIGYHFVIKRDGTVQKGRDQDAVGAHEPTRNATGIGVCLVGGVSEKNFTIPENNYTPQQWASLEALVGKLLKQYPKAVVQGHRDCPNVRKACPSFDALAWARKKGFPVPASSKPKAPAAAAA